MKKYEPKELVSVSRYRNYFPTLPLELQNEIYDRTDRRRKRIL